MRTIRWLLAALLLVGIGVSALAQDAEPTPDDDTIEIDVDEIGEGAENLAEDAVDTTEAIAETTLSGLQDLAERLTIAPDNTLLRVLFVVGGAILLLLGWRIYDEIIILAGVLVGAAIGASLVTASSIVVEVAALLIGGLIGALIAILLYYVAVFFIGAYVGLMFTYAAVQPLGTTVSDVILLIGALVSGILLPRKYSRLGSKGFQTHLVA